MSKKISDEIINQIPILYSQYKNKKKVAEELNISAATVNKYLNLVEATSLKKERKKIEYTEEFIAQINELYSKCRNMSQVSRELNISASSVKKYLTEENLKLKDKVVDDRDSLYFYIYKLFGRYSDESPVDPWNITQMQKFYNNGYSYRGQLLTLKYIYEIKKREVKKEYKTIGLIPYEWANASMYWKKQAERIDEINRALQTQLEQDRVQININPSDYINKKSKKKKKIDINNI